METSREIQSVNVPTKRKDFLRAVKWALVISVISFFAMPVLFTYYGISFFTNQLLKFISIIIEGPLLLIMGLGSVLGLEDLVFVLGWTAMISAPAVSFLFWTIVIYLFLRFKHKNFSFHGAKFEAGTSSLVSRILNFRPNKKLLLVFFILLVSGFLAVYIGKWQYASDLLLMIKGGCTSSIDFLPTRHCYGAVDRYIVKIGYLLCYISFIPLVLSFFFKRTNSVA